MEARLTRREFLAASGALVLAFSLSPRAFSQPKPPGSLAKAPFLDSWIRIDEKGDATVFTGKAELGQGIKTALIQLAAEELVLEPSRVALVTADTERTPNEMYTAGSHSMQDSGTAIRHAAAQVRSLLVGLAAERLGAPADSLAVANGRVRARDGRSAAYGELVAGRDLHLEASPAVALIEPAKHRIVGKPFPRVDIPAKVTGGLAYVQDVRIDGMVHGRIARPPSPAARLRSLDSSPVERMPGVLKVVRDGRFLGVIAEREWQSIQAVRALAAAARWQEQATLPPQEKLYETLLALPSESKVIAERGHPDGTGKRLEAIYRRPYQLHASIGPSCALAQLVDGKYTVWTHSQGVYPLRDALAELLGVAKESVHCIHVEGSGCYGHNAADDAAADAALLARALPGRPVRVQWMREDEHACEPFGPAMLIRAAGSVDATGRITGWRHEVWSNTHSTRPGKAGNLLAATHLERPFQPPPPRAIPQPEGGGDRNAIPLYELANLRVVSRFIPEMPLRVSALRGLGAYANVFALESFMDELALAAGADPVQFRLRHLADPRARAVIGLAAQKFGWAGYERRPRRGRGFAFARYKNLAGYVAIALELEAQRDTGALRLVRAVAAADSGEAVNPDGIRNQIEGGILQSASWTLCEEVTFDRTRITSRDWGGYPILRFPQIPASVEVHLIDRPGQPFLGTGEVSQGPTAAALGNALADTTGVRVRELPFSARRLRALLET
ncbi:MAG TPA: molybdopterin cofactor-binding domain-containing protein [Burkholderiales bacterium]|nr:molybdopterin cofactor-binding domain-containing protein [Burkholderiales bacterium]